MNALALARRYGVSVAFDDLGDWGDAELRSEYDPAGPAIRLNLRVAERLGAAALGEFVELAVGHELYHHRERIGEIPRIVEADARERAAGDYARSLASRRA